MDADTTRPTLARAQGHCPRAFLWGLLLATALVISAVTTISIGVVSIPLHEVWDVLLGNLTAAPDALSSKNSVIIWNVRTPRMLLALLVGAGLSVAGVAIQGVLRNVLADPYLIGISSGASTGAALVLLGFASATSLSLTVGAYLGSLAAILLVFGIARSGGSITSERFIFAGIIVGFAMTALTNLLIFLSGSDHGARSVMFWMLGSLNLANWDSLLIPFLALLVTLTLMILWGRKFDAISIGDDTARTLGTNPDHFRTLSLAIIAACVATLVAVSGAIGFLGLVVPHISRRMVGATHRGVFVISALLGSVLLMWSDALARTMFQPKELPIGVLTALLGTPLLLFLMRRLYAK